MARKPRVFIPADRPRCCGKNRYISRDEAERIGEEQELLTPGLSLAVYACLCGCGGWHLTRSAAAENHS
jgi:hypothetical protein